MKEKLNFFLSFFIVIAIFLVTSISDGADLQLTNLQGERQSLQDYRGKIVVLNFWATWCEPCREEMPVFVELQDRYASRDVQFIAASIDVPEDRDQVREFAKDFRLNFPIWIDATVAQQSSFGLGTAVPATAVFDREGNLRFRIIGQSKLRDLEKRIQYLLTGNTAEPAALLLPEGMTEEHFEQHHASNTGEDHHDHEENEDGGSEVPS